MSPEYIDFKDDGTVAVCFDGKLLTLRRPLFGEYADLLADIQDLSDAHNADMLATRDELPPYVDPDHPTEDELQNRGLLRLAGIQAHRVRMAEFRGRVVKWIGKVAGVLESKPASMKWPDDPDKLPAWLVENAEVYSARLCDHWRKVPLAPGESE